MRTRTYEIEYTSVVRGDDVTETVTIETGLELDLPTARLYASSDLFKKHGSPYVVRSVSVTEAAR